MFCQWYWDIGGTLAPEVLLREVQDPPIPLNRLEKLQRSGVIYTSALLKSVSTPFLTALSMTKDTMSLLEEGEIASVISALLERSKCALQHLVLRDVAVTNQGLVNLLKGTPSLKQLWLEARSSVDCKMFSELRDGLPLLGTLQLDLLHGNVHGPECSRFVKDRGRW